MTSETQLWAIEKRLESIEQLLINLQPKPKNPKRIPVEMDRDNILTALNNLLGKYGNN